MNKFTQAFTKLGEKLKKTGSVGLVLIVVALGLVLLLLPSGSSEKPAEQKQEADTYPSQESLADTEKRMESALSEIAGAGRVTVMLSLGSDGQVHIANDKSYSSKGEGTGEQKEEAVIVNQGSSVQSPVIVKTEYPEYRGALVVAEGASDPVVRLALLEAIKSLTGLGADKITVAQMQAG